VTLTSIPGPGYGPGGNYPAHDPRGGCLRPSTSRQAIGPSNNRSVELINREAALLREALVGRQAQPGLHGHAQDTGKKGGVIACALAHRSTRIAYV
jgi:hypothetical protein